jgi:hypothetical protein
MGNQTHRLKNDYTEEELQDSKLFRWIIQVHKPNSIGSWINRGNSNEWIATHPYTAVAQALIGDEIRRPLEITIDEMLSVCRTDEPDTIYWLIALDVMIIADEIAMLSKSIGGI